MFTQNLDYKSWPTPNYTNPTTQGPSLMIVAELVGAITLLVIGARLWVHMVIRRNPGLDDWLLVVTMMIIVAIMALFGVADARSYGLNRHTWDIIPMKFEEYAKFTIIIAILVLIAASLVKVSVLLFYRRVGQRSLSRRFIIITQFSLVGTILANTISLICMVNLCQPLDAFWKRLSLENLMRMALASSQKNNEHPEVASATVSPLNYRCMDGTAVFFALALVSALLDVIAATLPVALLWQLTGLPRRQRLALCVVFALGYVTCAAAFLRTLKMHHIRKTNDPAWVMIPVWTLSLLEVYLGAICASLPALRVFFRSYFEDTSPYNTKTSALGAANGAAGEFALVDGSALPSANLHVGSAPPPQPRFLFDEEKQWGMDPVAAIPSPAAAVRRGSRTIGPLIFEKNTGLG